MKIFLVTMLLTLSLHSEECQILLAKNPLIELSSRSNKAWIRVFKSPTRALLYGIDLNKVDDLYLSKQYIKCFKVLRLTDEFDYTLGSQIKETR